ncbi:hypothetical protein BGZ83_000042 [Gryganskiella cystojenkinii]|nr:hypothetical protein BGZ83_000042 [Gryganskiella cystojenkinii]
MTVQKFTLYNNSLCPYAARAILALTETGHKNTEIVEIDLSVPRPEWFLKLNPYGQVPTLKIEDSKSDNDHQIVLESLFVAEYLSDLHPEAKLMPEDALQRAQIRYIIHHWGARTQPLLHKALFSKDPEEALKLREEALVELGKVNNLIAQAHAHTATLNDTDVQGAFFLGEQFSFADLALAPFLLRLFLTFRLADESGAVEKDFEDRLQKLEKVWAWREAVQQRPSVQKTSPSKKALEDSYRAFLKKF